MSFNQFFRILWARRAVILLTTVAALLAGLVVIRIMPVRYDATSRVMLDVGRPDPVSGEGISSGYMRAYTKTQTELIRDYRVTGRVVDQLGWAKSPLYLAAYHNRARNDRRSFRRWLAQSVSDRTKVGLIDSSNILEITYSSNTSESARVIADAIRQAYIDQTLSFKRDTASRTAQWFSQQAQNLRTQLTVAEARKSAFEKANGVILSADNADEEEARLRAIGAAAAVPAQAAAVGGPAAPSALAAQLGLLDAQIASAQRTLGPNNPSLIAMQQQRAALASAAAREQAASRSVVAASGPSLGALYQQQQQRVLAQRGKVEQARQLGTEVNLLRDQFTKTSARATELEQQAGSTETGLTLLGSAVAPTRPAFPNKPLILFGALGLGCAFGIVVSLFVEMLSRRVRGTDDLMLAGVPTIGAMVKRPARHTGLRRITAALGIPSWTRSPA